MKSFVIEASVGGTLGFGRLKEPEEGEKGSRPRDAATL